MAGDAVVGVLRAIFGLDTAEFEDGAKRAGSAMQNFGKKMTEIASGIGLERILEKTAEAFIHLVKGALETADAMGKASQKFGVPVEELSSLANVAALSDLSLQQLGQGLGKLSKNMVAAQDSTSSAGIAFGALGIEVKNSQGNLKSSQDVLLEIAKRFSEFEDGATKTALAIAIFGKAGADMIPLLNQGADGIRKQREQAEKLGQVISKETAKQAEEFNDSLKSLFQTINALVLNLLSSSGLLHALAELSTKFIQAAADSDLLKKHSDEAGQKVSNMQVYVDLLTLALVGLTFPLRATVAALLAVSKGDFAGAWKEIADRAGGVGQAFLDANERMKNLGKDAPKVFVDLDNAIDTALQSLDKLSRLSPVFNEALTKSVEDFISATKKSIEVQQADIDAHGKGVGVRERLRIVAEAVNVAFEKGGELTKEQGAQIDALSAKMGRLKVVAAGLQLTDQLTQLKAATLEAGGAFAGTLAPGFAQAALSSELLKNQVKFVGDQLVITGAQARQLNDAMLKLQGTKLAQEFLDPWEQFRLKVEATNLALKDIPNGAEIAKQAALKAAAEMATAYGNVALAIVGPLASAFKDLAGMNKKYAGIAKAAAIAEALVQTYLGATKAYTAVVGLGPAGPALAIAAAAAATAAGLANVAKISATNFQTGGSFKVGGAGGVDSQLISLRATPGEMVDVRRPGSTRTGGAQEVTLNLPRADNFFSLHIREMVDALNKASPDGYVLKMAS